MDEILKHSKALCNFINAIPSADRPTRVYEYLKEQVGDIVDSEAEFEAWFERMAWHVEECNRLADRPQGHWTKTDVATYRCSECGKIQIADDVNELNFCCCCGSRNKVRRLKGADDEANNNQSE